MAAPSAVVVFTDADGDEFPVVVATLTRTAVDETAVRAAAERKRDGLVASGDWRPNGELTLARIETEG